MALKIEYRRRGNEAELVRLWGTGEIARVPRAVEGLPVTAVAPYAFSLHKDGEDRDVLVWEEAGDEGLFAEEPRLLGGPLIREVHLPDTVRTIGNYAFYGCIRLETFHGTERIERMGSGVFTGCRLSRIVLDFYGGEKSCLKEILTEIRYQAAVTLRYWASEPEAGDAEGSSAVEGGRRKPELEGAGAEPVRTVKLLFPEYLADFVENTPARIVVTEYHGSGGEYRECFYRRELDFSKYDDMFALSQARDSGETAACVALSRLMYPYRLEERARKRYEDYVRGQMSRIIGYCLSRLEERGTFPTAEPLEVVEFCCERQYFTRETLEESIEAAAEAGQTEVLSLLMDERHRRFPARKKTFAL